MAKQIVVIGNCAAGISALDSIRELDKESKLTVISDETFPAYYRYLIPNLLAGTSTEKDLMIKPADFYQVNNIETMFGLKCERIDLKRRQAVLENKLKVSFDNLIIATGASSKIPDIKGSHKKGVIGFRAIKDVKFILDNLALIQNACILSAGVGGLQLASVLSKRRIEVKVIDETSSVFLQGAASQALDTFLKQGIEVMAMKVTEIIGNGDVKALRLANGKVIAAQLVVMMEETLPNVNFIKESGIKIGQGVLTDEFLQTNIEGVFAAGDVAQDNFSVPDSTPKPLWQRALSQGKVAAQNICGQRVSFDNAALMSSAEPFDVNKLFQ